MLFIIANQTHAIDYSNLYAIHNSFYLKVEEIKNLVESLG